MANFSLAGNEGFRDKAGKSSQRVEWVRCVAWNKLAEIVVDPMVALRHE